MSPERAAYEAFQRAFPTEDWGPWELLDAGDREGWAAIAKAPRAVAELLTPAEAARMLGITVPQLARRADKGEVTPAGRTLGRHRRYIAAEIRELAAAEEAARGAAAAEAQASGQETAGG